MKKLNDQIFTYRETPVDYDGIAKITDIKGHSVVENGSLVSFTATEIKTTDKNLISYLNSRSSNGIIFTYDHATGGVKCTGTATANAYSDASASLSVAENYSLLKAGTYKITIDGEKNANNYPRGYFAPVYLDGSVGTATAFYNELSVTLDRDAYGYLRIQVVNGETVNTIVYPMIRIADTDPSFEPYKEATALLPIADYFPTGMKSAGDAYDELTSSKAITRIGYIDLGSLTWTSVSNGRFISTGIASLINAPNDNQTVANIICQKFDAVTYSDIVDNSAIGIAINGSSGNKGNICIKDSASYADADAFKTAMSGVILYYEMATPSETEADQLEYRFFKDGTERIVGNSYINLSANYYKLTDSTVPYRKFWMINGKGERWDFANRQIKTFFNEPQGLGLSKNFEVTQYGDKAVKLTESYTFPQFEADMVFYDTHNSSRYDKYNAFIRFIMDQPLKLYYQIPVGVASGINDIYFLDCDVASITKTESKSDNLLTANITLTAFSFYKGDQISINGTDSSYTITNDGDFPVGFEIAIDGNMENPFITLEQDGIMYGEAKFEDSTAFDFVYINSNDGEQNIELKQSGSILSNPLSYQDLSISNGSIYVTFVKLARGETTLTVGCDTGSATNVSIIFMPEFRSV